MRRAVYSKYNGRCAYCGTELEINEMHIDHIVARRRFSGPGLDDISNLNPSCPSCNIRKATLTIEEFRDEISKQVDRLKRDVNQFNLALRFNQIEITNKPVIFWFEQVEEL